MQDVSFGKDTIPREETLAYFWLPAQCCVFVHSHNADIIAHALCAIYIGL